VPTAVAEAVVPTVDAFRDEIVEHLHDVKEGVGVPLDVAGSVRRWRA
jgi:hypothetical protein